MPITYVAGTLARGHYRAMGSRYLEKLVELGWPH